MKESYESSDAFFYGIDVLAFEMRLFLCSASAKVVFVTGFYVQLQLSKVLGTIPDAHCI